MLRQERYVATYVGTLVFSPRGDRACKDDFGGIAEKTRRRARLPAFFFFVEVLKNECAPPSAETLVLPVGRCLGVWVGTH